MEKTSLHDMGLPNALQHGSIPHQFLRFCMVGVVAFIVNASLVELLVRSLGLAGAQIVAFPSAATTAWWLNRRFTFGASHMATSREWLRYMYANSAGWLLNNVTYGVLVVDLQLAQHYPCIAVAAGSIVGMTANFALTHQLVFKKT